MKKKSAKKTAAKPRGKQHDLRGATLNRLAKAHHEKAEYWRVSSEAHALPLYTMHLACASIYEAAAAHEATLR